MPAASDLAEWGAPQHQLGVAGDNAIGQIGSAPRELVENKTVLAYQLGERTAQMGADGGLVKPLFFTNWCSVTRHSSPYQSAPGRPDCGGRQSYVVGPHPYHQQGGPNDWEQDLDDVAAPTGNPPLALGGEFAPHDRDHPQHNDHGGDDQNDRYQRFHGLFRLPEQARRCQTRTSTIIAKLSKAR